MDLTKLKCVSGLGPDSRAKGALDISHAGVEQAGTGSDQARRSDTDDAAQDRVVGVLRMQNVITSPRW